MTAPPRGRKRASYRIGGAIKTVFEHSAGGIVQTSGGELVVVQTRNLAGQPVVTLPKGLVEAGETTRSAARREVTEETGFDVRLTTQAPAGVAEYWFVRGRVRVKKRVEFFRFTVTGGDPDRHDEEVDQVLVLEPESALAMLSYRTEREIVEKALEECRTSGSWPEQVTMRDRWGKATARPWNSDLPYGYLRLERGGKRFLRQASEHVPVVWRGTGGLPPAPG